MRILRNLILFFLFFFIIYRNVRLSHAVSKKRVHYKYLRYKMKRDERADNSLRSSSFITTNLFHCCLTGTSSALWSLSVCPVWFINQARLTKFPSEKKTRELLGFLHCRRVTNNACHAGGLSSILETRVCLVLA